MTTKVKLEMEPKSGEVDPSRSALLIIDMQRDFLEPKGFGESLGNDVTKLQRAIEPCQRALKAARDKKMLVIHTREGHRPDMTDVHPYKLNKRGACPPVIGQPGPNGRILIRGEPGHDIIPQLYPAASEPIIDKPGKGSFYATDLEAILQAQSIETIFVCGVTTEVCVHTTIREGNDRGYHCIALSDACASYFDEFHTVALKMISAQGGIFGSVSSVDQFVKSLNS
ncbi:amidohydrolase RutB [Seminavis robusta]|uniref:Amidohydrolase RutB n=1 Tax=Seminavis robusta TaxID=568900 RepID=A0A9N8DMH2_9STRA|nr:amidohydrolase RutB [Seminavis robusta]|eukprot:Sro215_g088930.1 amidohydrolase RutB (226) ;mRNA; f:18484-19273